MCPIRMWDFRTITMTVFLTACRDFIHLSAYRYKLTYEWHSVFLSLRCQSKKFITDLRIMYYISSNKAPWWCAKSLSCFPGSTAITLRFFLYFFSIPRIYYSTVGLDFQRVRMLTEDAYSSGHLVLSHFGTCMCSNVETNLSWTSLISGLLSFEYLSVLRFCLVLYWHWNYLPERASCHFGNLFWVYPDYIKVQYV